jgi:hypothetical protein
MSSHFHSFNNQTNGVILSRVPTQKQEHVILHRIWLFTTGQVNLKIDEHLHIIDCEECGTAFEACVGADSFGAVLKALGRAEGRLAG